MLRCPFFLILFVLIYSIPFLVPLYFPPVSSPNFDLHPRTLRSNIWRGILSATDQEIRDGMDFYPGAHGLCRLFSSIFNVSISQVAGIYAALSPMNGWYSNVSNVLDVLRNGRQFASIVNTTNINHWKALAILHGADPEEALGSSPQSSRKVKAFYRGISDPNDLSPIPVDRHLICLALGRKITSNQDLRSLASSSSLYSKIESAYSYLGNREGIGNRLASIAWFVQRRIESGQIPFLQPSELVCCGNPRHSHGDRWRCNICGSTVVKVRKSKSYTPLDISKLVLDEFTLQSIPHPIKLWKDKRTGRPCVYLGKSSPYSNSAGWQYLARYIVMWYTGQRLRKDEHVHHSNGNLLDIRKNNLEVWLAEHHGRYHANHQLLYMLRDVQTGKWMKSDVPTFDIQLANGNRL